MKKSSTSKKKGHAAVSSESKDRGLNSAGSTKKRISALGKHMATRAKGKKK